MTDEPKRPRGRPAKADHERRDIVLRVRVTADEAQTFERLNGAAWLREQLAKAKALFLKKGK
jgi:hypothetical protein